MRSPGEPSTVRVAEGTFELQLGAAGAVFVEVASRAVEAFDVGAHVIRQLEHSAAHVCATERPHRFTVYALDGVHVQLEAHVEPAGRTAARVTFRRDAADWREPRENHLLRAAIDQIQDVVLVTEAEPFPPRIVYANSAFTRMTGYTLEEVLGKTPKLLQGPRTDPAVQAYLRSRLRNWQGARAEVLNYRKDGTEFWVELDIAPVADATGWYTHWMAVQREVSERRRRDEDRLLASRMEVFTVLAGGAAHDFGNVLANIAATSWRIERLLERDVEANREAIVDATKSIADAVKHGRALTKQLIGVTSGKGRAVQALQLSVVVSDMVALGRMGSAMGVEVVADPSLWVTGDPNELRQLVLNLVINARGAMPDGGTLRVEVTPSEVGDGHPARLAPGRYAKLKVRDEGVGIAPENLVRVFDAHFTTKTDGSGLGLALVDMIVRRHGGHVSVRSEIGVFTELEVLLPAADPPPTVDPLAPA